MKLVKQTLMATAVASALLAGTSAMAAWTAGSTTTRTVIIQSTANVTGIPANAVDAAFLLTTSPQQSLTVNDQVIFTLTGGAKFTGIPVLSSSAADAAFAFDGFFEADGVTAAASGPVIKFHATDGLTVAGSTISLNTTGNIFNLSGVSAGTSVDLAITTKNVVGSVINSINNLPMAGQSTSDAIVPLFIGSNLLSCTDSQVVSAANTAEVTQGFKLFNDGFTPLIGDALTYTTASNAASPAVPIAANKIVYKIVGDFNGVTTVTASGVTGSNNAGSTTGGTVGQFLINAAKTEAYATNTVDLAGGATLALAPQFTIDGTTSQPARSFTLTTSVLQDTVNLWTAHEVACDAASYTINRNGSSFLTNFVGSANKIRITDVSGNIPAGSGNITVLAWNASGALVPLTSGSTFAIVPLASRQTRVINGADLNAAYPGAIHFEFAVESPAIEATGQKIVNGAVVSTETYTNKTAFGAI